jgi:hypothetical protein
MKKVVVAVLGAGAALGVAIWMLHGWNREFQARDAVLVIPREVERLFEEDPAATPDDVDRAILRLARASVIHAAGGADGGPVDPWGTPFRIGREIAGAERITTAASAGPDRRFGTEDDLAETLKSPIRKD